MDVDFSQFDFIDFGCSDGGSLKFAQQAIPNAKGCGIDIDPAKVEKACNAGHFAVTGDIFSIQTPKIVDFVTLSHFLEHLESIDLAKRMLQKAIELATHFVLVRQPWFDADAQLMQLGLKLYWSHWRGHRNNMGCLAFHSALNGELQAEKLSAFGVYGHGRIRRSSDPCLIPLNAGIDQHRYDPSVHGPKRMDLELPFPVYREIVVVAKIAESEKLASLLAKFGPLEPIFTTD